MEESEEIPQELIDAADDAVRGSLPEISKVKYQKTLEALYEWMKEKKTNSFSEVVLLAYFQELSKVLSPPSLWPKYSMIRTMLNAEKNINIVNYVKLKQFIKRTCVGHKAKKASVFCKDDLQTFLIEAPDDSYLCAKVVMIIGIAGACRRQELHNLTLQDVKDKETHLSVDILDTKTHRDRNFIINSPWMEIVQAYIKLRPKNCTTNNFFIKFRRGKCHNQPMGINTLGNHPQLIAEYLQLPTPKKFTSHSFRRTSATILINAGGTFNELKRHGGWKSNKVCEGYIEDSTAKKRKICDKLISEIDSSATRTTPEDPTSTQKKRKVETVTSTTVAESSSNITAVQKNCTSELNLECEEVSTDSFAAAAIKHFNINLDVSSKPSGSFNFNIKL